MTLLFKFSRIRVFAIQISRIFFITIYISNFLGALNFLGEEASAPSIREATCGGSGSPVATLGRSFGRIRRRALHQDLVRSLARSLAEIEIPWDGNALASLSRARRYIEIHPACSPPASKLRLRPPPLIPPLREMVTGNSADDGGGSFRRAPKYIQTTFTSQIEGNREAPSCCVSAPARKTN